MAYHILSAEPFHFGRPRSKAVGDMSAARTAVLCLCGLVLV